MDAISIVVEPTNSDSAIAFVLKITSSINAFNDLIFNCLKNYVPKNKGEAFDTLIIYFLMTSLTNDENNKTRASKRVIFGWLEKFIREHRNFKGIPFNENGKFYPIQNHIHYALLHSNLSLDNLLPTLNEIFCIIDDILKHILLLEENPTFILQ